MVGYGVGSLVGCMVGGMVGYGVGGLVGGLVVYGVGGLVGGFGGALLGHPTVAYSLRPHRVDSNQS